MSATIPHYLLFSEARCLIRSATGVETASDALRGEWHFVLESMADQTTLEVTEEEAETDLERLELWAVIRGLEALDQAAHVTLVTRTEYVQHGFRFGLEEWRENDWQWERFGEMVPVKHADLWRRVDRALRFHRVDCRRWRFDRGSSDVPGATVAAPHFPVTTSSRTDTASPHTAPSPRDDSAAIAPTRRFDAGEPSTTSLPSRRTAASGEHFGSAATRSPAVAPTSVPPASAPRWQRHARRWWSACREALTWWFDGVWEVDSAEPPAGPVGQRPQLTRRRRRLADDSSRHVLVPSSGRGFASEVEQQ